jgi:AAA15 family ATPase/GTPase
VSLHDNLTVLIGVNGAGKTNVMTAINLLSVMSAAHFAMIPIDKETEISFVFNEEDWSVELRVKATDNMEPELFWRMVDIFDHPVQAPLYFIQSDDIEKNSRAFKSYLEAQNRDVSAGKLSLFTSRLLKTKAFIESIRYYSAAHFSDVTKVDPQINTEKQDTKNHHNQFLYDLFTMRNESREKYERYRNLVCSEGIHLVDNILFKGYVESYDHFESEKPSIEKNDSEIWMPMAVVNNRELNFRQLSEGAFKTLALLFYIAAHDGGLLLLEEPEISVHHKLLKDVIEIIKNESEYKQILFSTHSDYVLDMLVPEDLVFVENGSGGTKAAALPSALAEDSYRALRTFLENEGALGEYWKAGGFDGA